MYRGREKVQELKAGAQGGRLGGCPVGRAFESPEAARLGKVGLGEVQ